MNDASVAAPSIGNRKPVLITGGAGFIGCNLADRLAQEGFDVIVFDALARAGVDENLAWLKHRHPARISTQIADVRDRAAVEAAVRDAQAVFHLAAQVAVTTSLVDPAEDFGTNLVGTFTLLDAVRRRGTRIPVLFASTNKVYGDLGDIRLARFEEAYLPVDAALRARGVDEERPLSFHTPYGCSKGAADQYVLDFSRSFGIPTAVLRMSCVYGEHQKGTEDQGWVAHFLLRALAGEQISIFGDGCQVRDVLHVDDAVSAYLAAWRGIAAVDGQAFNLGGGPSNAVSLRQVVREIEHHVGRAVHVGYDAWRPGDQRYYVSDTAAIERVLGWRARIGWREGIGRLTAWFAQARRVEV